MLGALASFGQKRAVERRDHRTIGEMGCEQFSVKLKMWKVFLSEPGERAATALRKRRELSEVVAVRAAEEGEQKQIKSGAMGLGKLEVVVQDAFDASHGEPLSRGLCGN